MMIKDEIPSRISLRCEVDLWLYAYLLQKASMLQDYCIFSILTQYLMLLIQSGRLVSSGCFFDLITLKT